MSVQSRHFATWFITCWVAMTGSRLSDAQAVPSQAEPQATAQNDSERQHVLEIYRSGKFLEAMPLLERLAADHPSDIAVREAWAYSVMEYSATLSDPELRRRARIRGRSIALQAKEMGDNSALLQIMLEIPEDGSEARYSDRAEVDQIMKAAEGDFARADLDKARDGYIHALLLDPNNYAAALFIGDTYFKQHVNGSAGEWFARAIQIDPNRETAYRYWGDALWDLGKKTEARDKYIQAIIAEPYNNRSWTGLSKWAQLNKTPLNWVRLQDRGSVERKDNQHTNIVLDAGSLKKGDAAGSAWLVYTMNRALWQGDKFKKEFPNEPKYRRSMREEVESLHLMVSVITEQKDFEKPKKDLDPTLLELIRVDRAGLLEPFTLLNRADNEIAQDYVPYRTAHRDTIYRYFDEFVVPKELAK